MEENNVISTGKLVAIGGSAGSLEVILSILQHLNNRSAAYVIVLHRRSSAESSLIDILSSRSVLQVKEAEEKEIIMCGTVYIAPADYHLLIEENGTFSLDDSEKVNFSRPSIDVTFDSASQVYGDGVTGVLLSGGNADGVEGLIHIKARGGRCVVQDPRSAIVNFMPNEAVNRVKIDKLLADVDIVSYLNQI